MRYELKQYNNSAWLQISQLTLYQDFIWEFKEKLDWGWISSHHPLDEDFIEEFKNFGNWEAISVPSPF